jgi:hypothetical protein
MTNRICALTVILDDDIREDDVQSLVDAILHMRRVSSVVTNTSNPIAESVAESRERRRIYEAMLNVIYPKTAARDGDKP